MNNLLKNKWLYSLLTAVLTAVILLIAEMKATSPMMLGRRLFGDWGFLQILLHALYSYWLTGSLLNSKRTAKLRLRVWLLFSFAFFFQFAIGVLGFDSFLQGSSLHYPIPALMVSAPIFRGGGFFMLILFLSTLLLVGPAWCSHLCYIGAIDNYFAKLRKGSPRQIPVWYSSMRFINITLAIATPLLLVAFSVSIFIVHMLCVAFIVLSIFNFFLSYRYSKMVYCSCFCPISTVSNIIGKINPFRLRIDDQCDHCQACVGACNYLALSKKGLEDKKVGINCTLCMDCIGVCHKKSLQVKGLPCFYILVVSLHSVFLALARL